jgi:hypothetical protein
MGPIGCPETSVQNYRSALRNMPEERRSQKHWLLLSERAKEGMDKADFVKNRYQVALMQIEYMLLFLCDVQERGRRLRVTVMGM